MKRSHLNPVGAYGVTSVVTAAIAQVRETSGRKLLDIHVKLLEKLLDIH